MTTTTTTTTTSTVMPVNPSHTLTQGISTNPLSRLGAQMHSVASAAIPQEETTTTTSLELRTQIPEMDFICFTEIPTSEFANAYSCTFELGGKNYQNATICFIAQQYIDEPEKMDRILHCETIEEAQFLMDFFTQCESEEVAQFPDGQLATILKSRQSRDKSEIMMHVLRAKFGQNPKLKEQLLFTGKGYIFCEGNDRIENDGFNVDRRNQLGKCLMQLRKEYGGEDIALDSFCYEEKIPALKARCSEIMTDFPQDLIGLFYEQYWTSSDSRSIQTLACTNTHFYKCITTIVETIKLEELCPLLKIISAAQAQEYGFLAEPTSVLPKLKLMKAYQAMSPHIEGNAGVTYFNFTLRDDLTLRQIVEIAKGQGIEVDIPWDQILLEIGDVAIAQVFPCMLANNVFKESRNKSFDDQLVLVHGHGCELPTVEQYIIHIVLIQKISNQCLFGKNPWTYGRSVTRVKNFPLVVGGSAPACLRVFFNGGYAHEGSGAGGWR